MSNGERRFGRRPEPLKTMNEIVIQITEQDLDAAPPPDSWACVDCGTNTAPGWPTKSEVHEVFASGKKRISFTWHEGCEVYTVREAIWTKAGLNGFGGCLCVGCLEKRVGRKLKPKDFLRGHEFNHPATPATPRLKSRRKD
jgi:hypothetical protein